MVVFTHGRLQMVSAIHVYRVARWLHVHRVPMLPKFLDLVARAVFSCWVPHSATIGRRVLLGYGGLGVVIHSAATIGDDAHIDQHVTIGGSATRLGVPTIGRGVYVGAGAKILGPITVGDHAVIGANAVVIRDVPPRCLVVGVPARIIKSDIDPSQFLVHRRNSDQVAATAKTMDGTPGSGSQQ
jgi:serine O-acetyltransferase